MNNELFTYSLRYVEELHNKLFGMRFSKDDFEQLNVLYDLKNLKSNLDLEDLYEKVEELIVHVTQEKVDEVASPTQLLVALKEVDDLKQFKTKAVTIFAVVQFGMAFWAWASKFM